MPAPPASDLTCLAQRRRFVALFTARVAADALLGPLFVPTDGLASHTAAEEEYTWWESALTAHSYSGRPRRPTQRPKPSAAHFARWCQLLDDTLFQSFAGPLARTARAALRNLATMHTHWQLVGQRRRARLHLTADAHYRMAA